MHKMHVYANAVDPKYQVKLNPWNEYMTKSCVFQIPYFLIPYNNSTVERKYIGQISSFMQFYLTSFPTPCKIAQYFSSFQAII